MSIKTEISVRLSSHLRGEAKKDFIDRVLACTPVLERVVQLCQSDIEKSASIQMDRDSFHYPNWDNQMAFELGYQKAKKEVIDLLTLRSKKEKNV